MTIRVLIADDHPVWRRGIRDLLNADPNIEVVAEASNGHEALRLVDSTTVDVLVLDMEMPGQTGVEVARTLKERGSSVGILALSAYDDISYVRGLLSAGASGYITKDKPALMIIEAVLAVARGEGRWFVQPTPTSLTAASELSKREKEVLNLLALGKSNAEIAEKLFISDNTVRNHLASLYSKIGVSSAREAVAWAWREGFITP
ncbi:MAG: response regulator transcription factor [Bacteroidota bacterium]